MLQAETQRARKYLAAASKKGEMLEKAADGLMGCFRVCASDRLVQDTIREVTVYSLIRRQFVQLWRSCLLMCA